MWLPGCAAGREQQHPTSRTLKFQIPNSRILSTRIVKENARAERLRGVCKSVINAVQRAEAMLVEAPRGGGAGYRGAIVKSQEARASMVDSSVNQQLLQVMSPKVSLPRGAACPEMKCDAHPLGRLTSRVPASEAGFGCRVLSGWARLSNQGFWSRRNAIVVSAKGYRGCRGGC